MLRWWLVLGAAVAAAGAASVGSRMLSTGPDCSGLVAFSSVGAAPRPDGPLSFQRLLVDKSVGWSSDTGELTCYCPGLYQFSYFGKASPDSRLSLKKKGSKSSDWETIVSTPIGGGSNLVLLTMEVGDKVAVFADGEVPQDTSSTTFSGLRVAKK